MTEVKLSIEPLYSWLAGKLLPSRHDLLSYAPQVMDQGYCNACTAFAVVTALSTYIMSTEGKRVTFDPFRLFFDSGGDCRNGNSLARVLEYVRLVGVKGSDGKVYKADPVPIHQRNINVYILNGIPVVTLLRVGKLSFTRYRRGVYNPFPLETKYNHALVILGFDDEREAYLCRNSMGRAWGEDGNVWIPYDYEFLATYAIAPIKTELPTSVDVSLHSLTGMGAVSYTHLTLPTTERV